jgi:ribosomal protein L35
MSQKTNKSYSKRIKVTKTGKIVARKAGGNHFNAKEPRSKQLNRQGKKPLFMTNKAKNQFLPHHKTSGANKLGRS